MVFFNYALRKLNAKIVYYGPGLCGKTTNLQWIHDHFEGGDRGKMISLATEGDRTIFFDLLPLEIGSIRGMEVTLQLYTVPGQVHYNSTRQLVLRGADGVVFVADSQRTMAESNVESFRNLKDNLRLQGIDLSGFPHAMQFNKRDLRDLMSLEDLDSALNEYRSPIFEAVATEGIGVQETLEGIVKLVMRSLRERYEGAAPPGHRIERAPAAAPTSGSWPAPAPMVTTSPVEAPAAAEPPAAVEPPAAAEPPPVVAVPPPAEDRPVAPSAPPPEPEPTPAPSPWVEDAPDTADIVTPPMARPVEFDPDQEREDNVITAVFETEELVDEAPEGGPAEAPGETTSGLGDGPPEYELDVEPPLVFEEPRVEESEALGTDEPSPLDGLDDMLMPDEPGPDAYEDHIRAPGPFAEIPTDAAGPAAADAGLSAAGELELTDWSTDAEQEAPATESPFAEPSLPDADRETASGPPVAEEELADTPPAFEPPGRGDPFAGLGDEPRTEPVPWDEDVASDVLADPGASGARAGAPEVADEPALVMDVAPSAAAAPAAPPRPAAPAPGPFVFDDGDPFADPFAEAPLPTAEATQAGPGVLVPHASAIDVQPDGNQLLVRLQGTGAIAESGEVRALDIEVPVPGSWVGNRRVTLQLRLTLSPAPEDGNDQEG